MDYVSIVNIVTKILGLLFSVLTIHFVIFFIVGMFFSKKYPETDNKLKYGVVIAARNEEKVIGNLIKSIRKTNYPQDKLQIFVIAHNCIDKTAEICRNLGAIVYEYNNPNEKTKGYALNHLFKCINKDYNVSSFDGYVVFDADNLVTENYFNKLNDSFVYYNKKNVIISYRNSKNFGSNLISSMYGVLFANGCLLESRGRTFLGCSSRVPGTGYVFSSDLVKDGWNYVTLTEDWELTADQILKGNKICYCDEAMFFDEQPTNFKVMHRQRLRWVKGHNTVFFQKFTQLFKSLFSKQNKQKFSSFDIMINIIPMIVPIIVVVGTEFLLLCFAPLFVSNFLTLWLTALKSVGISLLTTYLTICLTTLITFIVARKRINGVSFGKKVLTCLCFPLFHLYNIILEVIAFCKKVEWKTIPHTDTTTHEKVNNLNNGDNNKSTNSTLNDCDDETVVVEKM